MTSTTATAADVIEEAERIRPGLARLGFATHAKAWAVPCGALLFIVWMCFDLGLSPATFLTGLGKLGDFFGNMFPPSSGGSLVRILNSLLETIGMAFAGTALAVLFAIPLGLVAAKTILPFAPAHFLIRRILDFFRGIPALVWALVLVSAFGLGPLPGVLALALADLPILAKLNAEALENVDPKPSEALRASGGSNLAAIRYAVTPQVSPVMLSQALYYLESNFRNAAILGIVGAGGIGFELEERIRIFAFDEVAFIILLYMAAVAVLDTISGRLRKLLTR